MTLRRIVAVASFWLAVGASAGAQDVTAIVEGVIRSDAGVGVHGATITVRNLATGLLRSTTSEPDGSFVIAGLTSDGEYEIRAELRGFGAVARQGIWLSAGERRVIDFVLTVTAAESVSVSTSVEPAALDREHSMVRQVVPEPLIRSLPLVGRDFIQLASLAAGFTGNPDYPNPQGQAYWTNNVLVDGASHFSKWRSAPRAFYSGYGLESIREVQVLTNLFSAEFGEGLASVTTAATKAGTNQWHGSDALFLRNAALDAVPAFAASKPSGSTAQYAFSLGGPVLKDRTHFWVSYDGRTARDRNVVASPAALHALVPDEQDEHLVFARIDHQISSRQLATTRYNGQFFRWHHEPGGLVLPGSGTQYTNDASTLLATDTLQLTGRVLNEVRIQFARFVDIRQDLQAAPLVSRAGYSIQGGTLGPLGFSADPEDTWEAADTVSHWIGRHTLKYGAGLRVVRSHNTSLNYGRGAYFFAGGPEIYTTPFLFVQSFAPTPSAAIVNPRSVSVSGFVQDDWNVQSTLTLNLGVRYDVEGVSNVSGYAVPVDRNNFQPRLGLAWVPGGSSRTVVRGGVGLYTQQQLLYPINRVQLEGLDGTMTVTLTPDSPLMPQYPSIVPAFPPGLLAPARDVYRVGATLSNPYSIQATAGIERILFGAAVAADYVYLRGRDLLSLVDDNAPVSNVKPNQRTVAQADATRPLVPAPYRQIVTLGNRGQSWYRALQLKVRRTSGSFQTLTSYTIARAEDVDNYELPEDSRNIIADRARGSADVRHNVATGVMWELPGAALRGWSISGVGKLQSNRPYTITWGDDRNGTTQNDARPGGRNTGRTGPYRSVDLALTRRFHARATVIEGRLEAFNALNATNYDQYVGELLSPLFGRPVSAFPPRRLQVGAVVRF